MKTLVIIPAYNEEEAIVETINNLKKCCDGMVDYVIINDCSKDNTLKKCNENNFNVINLPINLGIGGAVQTGYKYAYRFGYDIAIQMDADGQHDPKYISEIIEKIKAGNDMVIGSRFIEKNGFQSTFVRRIGINLYSKIIKLFTGKVIKDTTSGMRAYDRNAIKEFVTNTSLTPEPDTMVYMLKKGLKIKEVQVEMKEREFGKSYLTPIKSMKYMVNMIFSIVFIRAITRKK